MVQRLCPEQPVARLVVNGRWLAVGGSGRWSTIRGWPARPTYNPPPASHSVSYAGLAFRAPIWTRSPVKS